MNKKNKSSFFAFVLSREVRFEIYCTAFFMLLLYLFLLWMYPFPNVYADTGAYITVAGTGQIGNFRPVGYSWLLALAHFINPDPDVLVLLQTVLYFLSTLFFYLTVRFFFSHGPQWLWRIFFLLFLLSPTCIYLCNYVISDCLFISLSNLWVASLLWIMGTRKWTAVCWNAILLILLLHTRYISLFYPLLTVTALFFAYFKGAKLRFFFYSSLQVALFFGVIFFTTWQTKKNVGVAVFSGFSGWQKANNAMHLLPYINLRPEEIPDPEIRSVHAFILANTPPSQYPPKDSVVITYIWSPYTALKKYLYQQKGSSPKSYLYYWHLVSIPFGKWADYVVKKYPLLYGRHYIQPNALSFFKMLNEGLFSYAVPSQQMKDWFGCNNCDVTPRSNVYHNLLSGYTNVTYKVLSGLFVLSLLPLPFRLRFSLTPLQYQMILLLSFFCIVYVVMSIYASPIVMRYFMVLRHTLILIPFLVLIHIFPFSKKL